MNPRTAGLDIGDKRIGVAVGDGIGMTAHPLGVVERKSRKADVKAIMDLLSAYEIDKFVSGLPLNMDGSEGEQADRVRHFCGHLAADTGIEIVFQDERMTSMQSERVLIEAGLTRKKRRGKIDATASALILQAYLDRIAAGY